MSSTPDNQPAFKPRICDYIQGKRFTKAEFLEFMTIRGTYDNDSVEQLAEQLGQSLPTRQWVQMPHFERLRKLHLADGRISDEQNEILKTVQEKIDATIENNRDALFELRRFLGGLHDRQTTVQLHDELKRRAICFLKQLSTQGAHEEWMENFADVDPFNIPEMIRDAQEFPVIQWDPEPAEQPAQPTPMSSTPPNKPRVYITYDEDYERDELTKDEFLDYDDDVEWEYYSASDMMLELQLNIADLHLGSDLVPHFKRFQSRHLASGALSNDQNEILKTVVEKIQGWAEVASTVLLSLKEHPTPYPTLHDEIKYKAVHFLEQKDVLMDYIAWIEHFARADPQNVTAMIEDAREFPNPPWQSEEGEQDEQDEPADQAEQDEQIE
ncbi:hypothetical protein F4679DRAFT_588073 [Xylaria curta]|nr:hypothetical protein F4679DRAFT_588073 [Xylaria curta]